MNYNVITQSPQHLISSIQDVANLPLTAGAGQTESPVSNTPGHGIMFDATGPTQPVQHLGNIATLRHTADPAVIDHYTLQRVINLKCAVSGRDLGSASAAVAREITKLDVLPPGMAINIRGQSQAMRQSFRTLGFGLLLAAALVYLIMAANFQSWLEPLIVMLAVSGALAGVLWMLALTHTTINVESLMGTIMAVV